MYSRQVAFNTITDFKDMFPLMDFHPYGSAFINNKGKDIDIACYSLREEVRAKFQSDVRILGFKEENENYGEDMSFMSLRKGEINLILFFDSASYKEAIAASNLCFLLAGRGQIPKRVRVLIHQVVRDPYRDILQLAREIKEEIGNAE